VSSNQNVGQKINSQLVASKFKLNIVRSQVCEYVYGVFFIGEAWSVYSSVDDLDMIIKSSLLSTLNVINPLVSNIQA